MNTKKPFFLLEKRTWVQWSRFWEILIMFGFDINWFISKRFLTKWIDSVRFSSSKTDSTRFSFSKTDSVQYDIVLKSSSFSSIQFKACLPAHVPLNINFPFNIFSYKKARKANFFNISISLNISYNFCSS